jgi:tetratricopeptide (TPR) repeat protein
MIEGDPMHPLPEALLERLKNRQAVLVTGLGCSALAGLPAWDALCERWTDQIGDDGNKKVVLDLLHAGQVGSATALCRELVPEKAIIEILRDTFPVATQVPPVLQALARAPWRGVITTAQDALWTSALTGVAELAERMVFAANAPALEKGRGRFLIQIFGRSDVPASLCLAPFEIAAKIVATGAASYLEALHKKWSFVFVGFGPGDPDLAMLAGRLLGASQSTLEHFFVAPELSPLDARRIKAEFGLVPVSLGGSLEDACKVLTQGCELAGDKPAVDEVEAWLERLTADPDDTEAKDTLDRGLAKLSENKEWERVVGALVGRAEHESDVSRQAADLYEAGMILDKELSAADRAYPVLMMALRLTPKNTSLLADTKRVAEAAGQSDEFLKELRELERESAEANESKPMALGVGRLLAEDPAQRDEAITSFQKVLKRDPSNPEALDTLDALLRAAERWQDLCQLYEETVEHDAANTVAVGKLVEMYERTGQTPQLIEFLQGRLARDPDDDSAYGKLETLYQQGQRWQPLGALYERMLGKNPGNADVQNKLEALYQKTQQWQPLGALYERRLAENPKRTETLDNMEELYRRSEQWRPLADLLERRAAEKDPAEARTARMERASILIDKVTDIDAALAVARAFLPADPVAAEEIFAKCVERDPSNPAALVALADLARKRGDYLRTAKFLLDAAERVQNPLELGRLYADAGTIHHDHVGDAAKAAELFERALAVDPEQTTAAQRLLGLREKREDWAGAEPLLDMLVRKADDGDKTAKSDLFQRQARAARKLGKLDKAVATLGAATKLDGESVALARELGDLHFEREAWAEARVEIERARTLLGDGAPAAERAALWEKLAACAIHSDDREDALRCLKEALALEPEKRSTLEASIDLRTAQEDWKEVLALKRRLLPLVTNDDDTAGILEAIGDLQQEKLGDWTGAMESYLQALGLAPERRQILYKTLDYYTQEKQWPLAVAALEKLASLEGEPRARANLNYAAAAIHRDEAKDSAKAIEQFGKVLDDDPLYPKAFEAIEKLLAEGKELKELERAYRKQIKRLPQDVPAEVKLRLWDALADVALKQHDRESAALTMEVAVSFDRDNFARQERLAKMYFSMGPSAADKAIAQHQYLLSKQPDRVDSYKTLAALFFQVGAHDKMWCVAGAMTCLGKADPPLRALYENLQPSQMLSASGKLNEELWRRILHPTENNYLGSLFALLSPAIAMITAQPHKVMGLDRRTRVDVAGNSWSYAATLRYVANAIETPLPEVFVKKDMPGTVNLANLKEKHALTPALVIGHGFAELSSPSQVIFDLTKRMVLLRPERFPRFALGTTSALDVAVRAGLKLGGSPIGPGDHGREVDKMAKKLDGLLAAPLRTELKALAKRYVDACGDKVDIPGWIVASDLTASRAALVLCGDIVAAAQVLAIEPSGQSPLTVQDRIKDLLSFFISEDHFAVRAALGMQVNLAPPDDDPTDPQPKRRISPVQIKIQ